jgi:hypothetical protein
VIYTWNFEFMFPDFTICAILHFYMGVAKCP